MAEYTSRIMKADGTPYTITGPAGATPDQVDAEVRKQNPETAEIFAPKRGPLDVIFNPQGSIEQAMSFPVSAAITGGAGRLAGALAPAVKYAPAFARSAAEGVQRGVGSLIQGEGLGDILTKAGLGTATAGATEGIMGLAGKVGSRLAGTTRFHEMARQGAERGAEFLKQARQATDDAFDAISSRLLGGKISVPSISTGKLSPLDAIEELNKLTGPKWAIARDEIAAGLNVLDRMATGAAQKAGDVWKAALPANLFAPRKGPAPRLTDTNVARSIADVITGTPIEGVPAGALAAGGLTEGGMPHLPIGTLIRGH